MKALFYPDVPFETLYIPHIYREIYFDNIYNIPLYNDMTVLDVGANIGIATQYLRERVKAVYSLEPSPEHYEALLANKVFNEWENVETHNLALADYTGWATLNRFNVNRTCNSIVFDRDTSDKVEVKTIRLDDFLESCKIEHVDFMKLDVEGAEDMIIRGEGFQNVTAKIDSLMVEFHLPNWLELWGILKGLGYQSVAIKTGVNMGYFWRPK